MAIDHERVVELSRQIQILTKEISDREARLQELVRELERVTSGARSRVMAARNPNPSEVPARHLSPEPVPPIRRRPGVSPSGGRQNQLPAQIIAHLENNKGRAFTPSQLLSALELSDEKRPTLNTTLYRILKEERIDRNENGYIAKS